MVVQKLRQGSLIIITTAIGRLLRCLSCNCVGIVWQVPARTPSACLLLVLSPYSSKPSELGGRILPWGCAQPHSAAHGIDQLRCRAVVLQRLAGQQQRHALQFQGLLFPLLPLFCRCLMCACSERCRATGGTTATSSVPRGTPSMRTCSPQGPMTAPSSSGRSPAPTLRLERMWGNNTQIVCKVLACSSAHPATHESCRPRACVICMSRQ